MRPPGWPASLEEPDHPEFEAAAVRWLLDLGPASWREQALIRERPVVLAFLARHEVDGRLQGARTAYSLARQELAGEASADVVAELLSVLEAEGAALLSLQREVALVEEALQGRRWRPRL